MREDVYTYEQILCGLREEYLIIKKELDELDEYIIGGKTSKYAHSFRLGTPLEFKQEEKAKLMIDVERIKKEKFYRLKSILEALNIIKRKQTSTIMIENENGMYIPKKEINGKIDKRFDISIKNEEEFAKRVNALKETEFSRHMAFTDEELNNIGFINNSGARIWETAPDYSFDFSNEEIHLNYIGRSDIVVLSSIHMHNEKPRPITKETLQKALDTKFPKDAFSSYHRKVIDSSKERKIVFQEYYSPITYSKFNIEDNGKTLVLYRQSNNKDKQY